MKKNSFILYSDYLKYFNKLDLLEKGKLIDALLKYGQGLSVENEIKEMESSTEMAFLFIANQIDIDAEKYDKRCVTSKANGSLGGRPKKTMEDEPDNEETNEDDKKTGGKKKKQTLVLNEEQIEELINQSFKDEEVASLFKKFIETRKAKGQSKAVRTRATFDGLVNKLRKYASTKEQALEIIQNAIDGCWQSFFPLNERPTKEQEVVPYAN